MTVAKKGDTVKVHYTGKLDNGQVFDSSDNREPLKFKIRAGQVIRGFEDAIIGMEQGETKTVKISAEKAYGPHNDELVAQVDKNKFPDHIDPKMGDKFKIESPDGKTNIVRVTGLSEQKVELDANHPLAGEDLHFDLELVEIVK
jgi:peptidylprolyl isomerase